MGGRFLRFSYVSPLRPGEGVPALWEPCGEAMLASRPRISARNHEKLSESGPYGSVWGHIQPESIPRVLGSLWDTSRALKPPRKTKNPGFRGLGEIPPISPYYPSLGLSHRLTVPAAGVPLGKLH